MYRWCQAPIRQREQHSAVAAQIVERLLHAQEVIRQGGPAMYHVCHTYRVLDWEHAEAVWVLVQQRLSHSRHLLALGRHGCCDLCC